MIQSQLLEFQSSYFAIESCEDQETNPGIYGKALAHWLVEELRAQGIGVNAAFAEDFGWCIPVTLDSHQLFIACADIYDEPGHWGVFAFAEGGFWARLFGKDKRSPSLAALIALVKHILESTAHIKHLSAQDT